MREADKLNKIALRLEKCGYKVRRHYYEYYIRHEGAFICIASLFPKWNYVFILFRKGGREHLDKIVNVIRGEFPNITTVLLKEVG